MKRTELRRKTPLARRTPLKATGDLSRGEKNNSTTTSLKRGRGFSASPAQQKKVKGMHCLACSAVADDYTAIDPAHICSRGMGGCDDPLCVIPLCRWANGEGCHSKFDRGELDLIADLEPYYRAEVAHAVMHLGLEGVRVRLCPSVYRSGREAAA